jgi:hypothetical protein
MKYNVGDKVRVREDLEADRDYGDGIYYGGEMTSYAGKVLTISNVHSYKYEVEENFYDWTDEMLEPVAEEESGMDKQELRNEIEHMPTYKFGEYNKHHDKLNKVTSYVKKSEVLEKVDELENTLDPRTQLETAYADILDREEFEYDGTKYVVLEKSKWSKSTSLEKPVVPKFVANWFEKQPSLLLAIKESRKENSPRWFYENRSANETTNEFVARLWLDGYTVEEEPKYYAKIKGWENVTANHYNWAYFTEQETVGISGGKDTKYQKLKFNLDEWANLGITDDNADFEEVESS